MRLWKRAHEPAKTAARSEPQEAAGADPGSQAQESDKPSSPAAISREEDGIYQKNRLVARVSHTEIDEASKEIRFEDIRNSDELLLADECEFRQYRIVIRKIAYSTKVGKDSQTAGRILEGVKAEILGTRQ
ncbi:MAG: hypothetical protein ACRD2B_17665 [Terriglobia bacterium]